MNYVRNQKCNSLLQSALLCSRIFASPLGQCEPAHHASRFLQGSLSSEQDFCQDDVWTPPPLFCSAVFFSHFSCVFPGIFHCLSYVSYTQVALRQFTSSWEQLTLRLLCPPTRHSLSPSRDTVFSRSFPDCCCQAAVTFQSLLSPAHNYCPSCFSPFQVVCLTPAACPWLTWVKIKMSVIIVSIDQ